MNNYSASSPSTRPGARRRESTDILQNNQVSSPTGSNRFSRDESHVSSPPPSLLRRRTDFKESTFGPSLDDKDEGTNKSDLSAESTFSFGTLKRTATVPTSSILTGPSSPWAAAPQSAGFSPMGAFGNFSLGGTAGQPPTPIDKKSTFGSLRGESRFKGLMNTEDSEDSRSKIKEKASISSLEQLNEATTEPSEWNIGRSIQSRGMTPYQEDEQYPIGSAALGGDDASPPRQHASAVRSSDRQMSYDDIGFSSLGLTSDMPQFRDIMQRRDFSQGIGQNQPNAIPMNEPMSPTNTNPYQSPEVERAMPDDFDADDSDAHNIPFSSRPFGHHRGFPPHEGNASDRSQTSSAGAPRGFPSLNTLGALGSAGPWPNAPGAIGTPTRAMPGFSSGFGDPTFSPINDVNPNTNVMGPSSSFLGGAPPSAIGNAGHMSRGSKMGSLFPNAMQEQMRGDSSRQEQGISENDLYQRNVATSNAPGFGASLREIDSPLRPGRGMVDELFGNIDARNRVQGFSSSFGMNETSQPITNQLPTPISTQIPFSAASTYVGTPSMAASAGGSYFGRAQDQDTSNQMPASQQRQMVMPDRMRWIYRDPQGNTQGPWSGLEMHDWYKAGFFSPELQVKKLEDTDYEPLAQLIRRIGNSREPFLVPQIGIPHGSSTALASSNASASGAVPATTPSAMQSNSAQPPFAGSFPSFGTTLTAEQQNALERRKQEEQFLMARQKEHLAAQQVILKTFQLQGVSHGLHGQQLHHHSSAHSLQSQPSYGSITSPTAYQPASAQGPIQPPAAATGFFDHLARNGPLGGNTETLGSVREDEVAGIVNRINAGRGGQMPIGGPSYNPGQGMNNSQQVEAMLQERARLQREQEHYDMLHRNTDDHREMADRLDQFHLLRTQMDEPQHFPQQTPIGGQSGQASMDNDLVRQQQGTGNSTEFQEPPSANPTAQNLAERLSLSEQVQKAAALAKQSPSTQPQSPWAKVETNLPQPFPPPQSSSPLPAPAAQRNRQNVADTLTAESRSRSQTPSVETPSTAVAPWAKETNESSKGPSLKDIQAMEARKAAQQEEIAAAARRAVAEQERQNQSQPPAQAPGLPSSANWASGVAPAVPMSGTSAWTKPAAGKLPSTSTAAAKKTLAQIQKEEEARKNRDAATAAASAANNLASTSAIAGGKRYADLAGKAAVSVPQLSSTAWTTVGAGGKVKTPAGPAPSLNTGVASSNAAPPPVIKPKATLPSRGTTGSISNQQTANDEFQKWAKNALGKGLNSGIPSKISLPKRQPSLS